MSSPSDFDRSATQSTKTRPVPQMRHLLIPTGVAVAMLTLAASFPSASAPALDCRDDDLHRQFDFWLGTWDVFNEDGELLGSNQITTAEDGCVLIERWQGRRGSTGMSINYVDPSTGDWKQAWVAASGYVIELTGGLVDGDMELEGVLVGADGTRTPMRGRWSPLDDGRVRQQFHVADSTQNWNVWFDGYYARSDEER